MGLDMYLKKRIAGNEDESVGYWRKANQIHGWFVKNVQNDVDECQECLVPYEKVVELYKTCLEVNQNIDKGAEKLPTSSGFFFGRTEYDQWYIQDVADTIKILEPLIQAKEKGEEFEVYYRSSW